MNSSLYVQMDYTQNTKRVCKYRIITFQLQREWEKIIKRLETRNVLSSKHYGKA